MADCQQSSFYFRVNYPLQGQLSTRSSMGKKVLLMPYCFHEFAFLG